MSNYSYVDMLIEELYGLLEPEHLFSRAKEYSWQTFFHHCVSTALISYRLGLIIKKNAYSTIKLAIESMERSLGNRIMKTTLSSRSSTRLCEAIR